MIWSTVYRNPGVCLVNFGNCSRRVWIYQKGQSESENRRRTENTMAKRKSTSFLSRFICKHSDTYTSVTRGHFLNNIYIQDMTEWRYDEKIINLTVNININIKLQHNTGSYI